MVIVKNKVHNKQELEKVKLSNSRQTFGRLILLGILICATLINVIQFYVIDYHISGRNYSVLNSYGTHDLLDICFKVGNTTVVRYSPYLGLSKIATGANVFLTDDCPLITQDLYGLGRVANVKRLNYNAITLFADFDPAYYEVEIFGKIDNRGPGKVAIVFGEDKPLNLIALWRDDMWHLVDVELLNDNGVEELFRCLLK